MNQVHIIHDYSQYFSSYFKFDECIGSHHDTGSQDHIVIYILLHYHLYIFVAVEQVGILSNIETKLWNWFTSRKEKSVTIAPLFRDYETYASSLPVRFVNQAYRKLYTLEYFVRSEDLKSTANRIMEPPPHRVLVKYMTGPSICGKQARCSQIFLRAPNYPRMQAERIIFTSPLLTTTTEIFEPILRQLVQMMLQPRVKAPPSSSNAFDVC